MAFELSKPFAVRRQAIGHYPSESIGPTGCRGRHTRLRSLPPRIVADSRLPIGPYHTAIPAISSDAAGDPGAVPCGWGVTGSVRQMASELDQTV